MIVNLEDIKRLAFENEVENKAFIAYLSTYLDRLGDSGWQDLSLKVHDLAVRFSDQ